LIEETAFNLQKINAKKTIELRLKIDEKLRQTLIGDPFRIRQILTNLIGNAYKFTEKGSINIVAQTEIQDKETYKLIIKVIDSGIGIAKEKQETIFKEFTQAETTTEKKYGGYGLGLTISKKLASLLGGSLNLKSDLGKGSEFTLSIPLKLVKNSLKHKQKEIFPSIQNKLSILILDDDMAMLGLLKEVCSTMQLTADTFSNFEALAEKRDLKYDVVLTDIQMPNIDGFEVLKQLKSGNILHYKNQPVLAMTGRKDLEKDSYTSVGFAGVLQKPFSKATFMAQLSILFPEKFQKIALDETSLNIKNNASLYNLSTIMSFLGNDTEGIKEVIETFLEDTSKNVKVLSKATQVNNIPTINAVAHRMLPMFRQIEAKKIVPILEKFELLKENELDEKELKKLFNSLKGKTAALKSALKRDETIAPTYND
jgi:CheY-like chemotaxis protein